MKIGYKNKFHINKKAEFKLPPLSHPINKRYENRGKSFNIFNIYKERSFSQSKSPGKRFRWNQNHDPQQIKAKEKKRRIQEYWNSQIKPKLKYTEGI